MNLRILPHDGWEEIVLALPCAPGESASEALLRAVSVLHREDADLLRAVVFGRVTPHGQTVVGPRGIPATFIEGAPCSEGLVAGVQVVGARGVEVACYEGEYGAMATVVEDRHARWAYVSNVAPSSLWAPPGMQAREAFERAEATLRLAGMGFEHVYRTWLFVEDILGWYGDLNRVRTAFYSERGVFRGVVPASTGVGASNPVGAALTMDALAVSPLDGRIQIRPVESPLQCSAQNYGSSFSRALEIVEPGLRRLVVSGTASIGRDGSTLCVGDVAAQTDWTLDVVEAILRSRAMDWSDVTRAVAYFRNPSDWCVLPDRWVRRGAPDLPVITAASVICRDDLLFEIELDAARPD